MTKDELIHHLRMIAQGRPNFAEPLADFLMPDPITTKEVVFSSFSKSLERIDGGKPMPESIQVFESPAPETVDIEVEGLKPDPVKPKRKKG